MTAIHKKMFFLATFQGCVSFCIQRDLFLMKHLSSVAMVELDGDDIRISSRGKLAERDIVQVRCFILCLTLSHHGNDAAHFPEL